MTRAAKRRRSFLALLYFAAFLMFAGGHPAVAASPAPSPARIGDIRTGRAASMSGDPVLALVAVLALGFGTAIATVGVLAVRTALKRRD